MEYIFKQTRIPSVDLSTSCPSTSLRTNVNDKCTQFTSNKMQWVLVMRSDEISKIRNVKDAMKAAAA